MVLIEYFKNFKLFPSYEYKFKLLDNESDSIERLNRRTERSDRLFTKRTDKSFIGKIENNTFRIISSEIGKGVVWVMDGDVSNGKCLVKMTVNYPFRILYSILYCMPFLGFVFQTFNESNNQFEFFFPIVVMIGQMLLIRYVLLDVGLKNTARRSIYRLRDIVDFEVIG